MLVRSFLAYPRVKKWNFLRPNNNPADFERSELVGKIAKLIQQSVEKKGLQ